MEDCWKRTENRALRTWVACPGGGRERGWGGLGAWHLGLRGRGDLATLPVPPAACLTAPTPSSSPTPPEWQVLGRGQSPGLRAR